MGWTHYLRSPRRGADERELDDLTGDLAPSDVECERGSRSGERGRQVREGDPPAEAGREATAGRLGDALAVREHGRAVSGDRAFRADLDAREAHRQTVLPFLLERVPADERVVELDEPVLP